MAKRGRLAFHIADIHRHLLHTRPTSGMCDRPVESKAENGSSTSSFTSSKARVGFDISSVCGMTVVMQGKIAGRNVSQAGRLAAHPAPDFEVNLAAGG